MKKHLYLLLVAFIPFISNAQRGHISIDSTTSSGIKLINGGEINNAQFIKMRKGNEIIEYTPEEVKEYGFREGSTYVSKYITISGVPKRVFLERLTKGKLTLYYYREKGLKTFFLEKDSTLLVELPKGEKGSYKTALQQFTSDCPQLMNANKLTSYKKLPLTKVVERYHECKPRPFPHFRYGLIAGCEFSKLIPTNENDFNTIDNFNFGYKGGFMFGAFLDAPIYVSDVSFHMELLYSSHNYSYNKVINENDIDFLASISSLKLPALFRYTYPSNKIRPFINAGGFISYNFSHDYSLYKTERYGNVIEINRLEDLAEISDFQFGFSGGIGMEYKLSLRNYLFFELRYNYLLGENRVATFDNSEIQFITSLSF